MVKVTITRDDVITHQASFETKLEADAWVAVHESQGNFGDPSQYKILITGVAEAIIRQQNINNEALAYIASTNWIIIRALERGEEIPADIKQSRQEARDKIVEIINN
jgi:hypothetical protein